MSEKVELELLLKGGVKAVKTMGELEKALSDAREEIKGVTKGSKDFKRLATAIQQASSEVKTLEKKMEGLEPQQKAEAFLKLGEGIAGGFAVGQGAMALFGVESENLQKLQVKVQAAISIAMGARMMSEAALMASTAKRVALEKISAAQTKATTIATNINTKATKLATVVQNFFTGSVKKTSTGFKALKASIMSTGLGALVILITAAVSGINNWIKTTKEQTEAQTKANEQLLKENEAILGNLALKREKSQADSEEEVQLIELREKRKANEEAIKNNNEAIKKNNEIMSSGVSKDLQQKLIDENNRRSEGNTKIATKITLLYSEADAIRATIKAEAEAEAEEKQQEQKRRGRSSNRRARRKSEAEQLRTLQQEVDLLNIADEDEREKAKLEQDKKNAIDKAKTAKNSEEQIQLIKDKFAILEAERQQEIADKEYDAFIENSNRFNEEDERNRTEQKEKDKKAADEKIALDKAVFDAKRGMEANAFSASAALFEKNKKISKAIAVSQTIYSTQQAIMDALAAKGTDALLPYPIRLTNAISAGVIGAASIRNIMSESMGEVSVGGGDSTPDAMIPSTTGAFTLGGSLPDQEPVRAYVITDELSDSQAQLSDIRRRSTI